MMTRVSTKMMMILVGMIFSLSTLPHAAYATSVQAVIDQVDQEYADGQMDTDTHRDLVLTLQKAQAAASGSDQYIAAVEAFQLLVSVYGGGSLTSAAASRISTLSAGL